MARKVSKKFKITVSVIVVIIFLTLFNYFMRVRLILAAGENDYKTVKTILNIYPLAINQRFDNRLFEIMGEGFRHNNTPLMEACEKNNTEIIKLLVERGADINKHSRAPISYPLIAVLQNRNYEMAWYLIEHGADVLVSEEGWFYADSVPAAILGYKVPFDEQDKERQYELMKYVIEKGVSLDPPYGNHGKAYILREAVSVDNSLVVEYIIQNGYFDVDISLDGANENYNWTSLIFALKLEIDDRNRNNEDPNAEKTDGSRDTYGMCETLLKLGADKTLKDIDGKTALDYAIELGDEKLISLLSD